MSIIKKLKTKTRPNFFVRAEELSRNSETGESRAAFARRAFRVSRQNFNKLTRSNRLPSTRHLMRLRRAGFSASVIFALLDECFAEE